jgi:hypothetical protein
MTNSNQKGKRGERQWRDKLREHGFLQSYRSQQYCGSEDSADVICEELPKIHFEVKYCEKLSLYDAMAQAVSDAGENIPVVAHRRNDCDWLVIMRADDWMGLIKETDHVKFGRAICNQCWTDKHLIKYGVSYKSKQRYICKKCWNSFHFGDSVNDKHEVDKVQTLPRNT